MPTAVRFDDVLEALHSHDEAERERAARHLAKLGRAGLTTEQGIRALKASTLPYPQRRDSQADTSVDLIKAALSMPFPEYLPQIVQRYAMWSDRARAEVLSRLTRIQDIRAAEAIVAILEKHARNGEVKSLPLGMYSSLPQFPEVLFPALLNYLDVPGLRMTVCQYALAFAAANLIDHEMLAPHAGTILEMYRVRRDRIAPKQKAAGTAWRWGPRYHRTRWTTGVLLDLMGYIPGNAEVVATLQEALAIYTDTRLRMYTVLALFRQNQDVDPKIVGEVAACPESRKWLYDGLQKLERFHLYPVSLRSQAALAESDLVDWLVHGRELGRAPDKIELMKVVPFEGEGDTGWLDYYLFRFKVSGKHWAARSGWMAGVAGPFLRKDAPTIQSLGDTHSSYRRWDEKKLEGHVSDIRQLMKAWRERHYVRDGE